MVIASILVITTGCKHENPIKENIEDLEFSMQSPDKNSFVDSLDVRLIQFEETDESLIQSISQIQQYGNKLLISDNGQYKLLVFKIDGKYEGQIGSRGQAGGEYVKLTSFFVEDDSKKVYLWDDEGRKLLTYNLSDYSFIKEINLPEISSKCCIPIGNNIIWFNDAFEADKTGDYFLVTDKDGKIKDSYVKKLFKSGYITGSSCPLFKVGGVAKGFTPYDLALYTFTSDGISNKLNITIKDFNTPSIEFLNEISEDGTSSSLFRNLSDSEFISYYEITETETLLGMTVMRQHETYIGIADKNSSSTYFDTPDNLAERLKIGKISYLIPNSIDDGLLAIIDKDDIEMEGTSGLRPELLEMIDNNNNNPIIAIIRKK